MYVTHPAGSRYSLSTRGTALVSQASPKGRDTPQIPTLVTHKPNDGICHACGIGL